MNYYGKDHLHKPKKGKGSYVRVPLDSLEKLKEVWPDEPGGALCGYIPEVDDRPLTDKYRGQNKCRVNTTTVDGAMPPQDSLQQTETDSAISCPPAPKPSTSKDEKLSNTSTTTDQQTSGLNPTFRQ